MLSCTLLCMQIAILRNLQNIKCTNTDYRYRIYLECNEKCSICVGSLNETEKRFRLDYNRFTTVKHFEMKFFELTISLKIPLLHPLHSTSFVIISVRVITSDSYFCDDYIVRIENP